MPATDSTDSTGGTVSHPQVTGEPRLLSGASSSRRGAAGPSRTSTLPPKRCSASPRTGPSRTWTSPSRPRGRRSTTPTGRPTGAFRSKCLAQLHAGARRNMSRSCGTSPSPRSGSPISLTYMNQVDLPLEDLAYWIDKPERYEYEETLPDRDVFGQAQRRVVVREAVGVVGAITPWNFPLNLNLAKLGPALAAGNTVVLKPAPDTPWSATVIGRIIAEETDIPAGVVNIVAVLGPPRG